MHIISIQSRVIWGYVGNAVAIPALQAFHHDALPIDTIRLAHHPGHGKPWGTVPSADEIDGLLTGALKMIDGPVTVLMGYLGSDKQGHKVLQIIEHERQAGRDVQLCLDPAFGDTEEGVYVADGIVDFYRGAAAQANYLMPNAFEFGTLTGTEIDGVDAAVRVFKKWHDGPDAVLVSSIPVDDTALANVLLTQDEGYMVTHPRRELSAKGTGDLLSAAFMGALASGLGSVEALACADAVVERIVEDAGVHNRQELSPIPILREISSCSVIQSDNIEKVF